MQLNDVFYYDETSPSCLRWKIAPSRLVHIGDIAGSIHVCGNGIERHRVMYGGKYYTVSRVIYQICHGTVSELSIDHINGNALDNRIENLRLVSVTVNGRNRKKNSNNTSGKSGVYFHKKSNSWRACWTIDGVIHQKSFSCNKYSDAFVKATEYRKQMIELLGNYTERHGTNG